MIKKILDKFKDYIGSKDSGNSQKKDNNIIMPGDLQSRISHIKEEFKHASDMVFREFEHASKGNVIKFFLFNVDGIADKDAVNNFVMKPLMIEGEINFEDPNHVFNEVKNRILTYGPVTEAKTYQEMIADVLSGDTALLIDNYPVALIISTRRWETRTPTEPEAEPVAEPVVDPTKALWKHYE